MCAKRKEERDPDSGSTARGDDAEPDDTQTVETDAGKRSDPELIRGKIIGGKYEIISHLGSGAMGAVYKALHKDLNKVVAIKVLLSDALNDPVKKKRFLREARAQGGLTHRNIAAVHDVGLTEKEEPYFVMDFLQGQTLEEYVSAQKSLDCHEFIDIFEQVARGLQHAHSKGIVHRDIKPGNIMLIDSEDGGRQALVVDFGIAVDRDKSETKLTKPGYIVGTPCYMSPEQIEGKDLDARSDIYSLGCVMFESLTGNLPFTGINAAATMALHLAQPAEHISTFKTKSPLPQGMADLVMRCLEKDPQKRFSTAKEIAAQLNSLKQSLSPQENAANLVGAGSGHESKNPAPSPPAAPVEEKSKSSPGSNQADSKSPDLKVSDKIILTEKDQGSSDSIEIADAAHINSAMENDRKIERGQSETNIIPTDKQAISSTAKSSGSGSQRAPIDGHDIIAFLIVGVFGILIWPQNGRLALPLEANEMRDDNPFFRLAKFLVETYNSFAHDAGWQFIIWAALLLLAYKVVQKLLKSGHTD